MKFIGFLIVIAVIIAVIHSANSGSSDNNPSPQSNVVTECNAIGGLIDSLGDCVMDNTVVIGHG